MFVHHKKKQAVELAVFFYPWYKLWPKIYVGLYYYKKLTLHLSVGQCVHITLDGMLWMECFCNTDNKYKYICTT